MTQILLFAAVIVVLRCPPLNGNENIQLWKTQEKNFNSFQGEVTSNDNMKEDDFNNAQSILSNGDIRLAISSAEKYEDNNNRIQFSSGRLEVYVISLLEKKHARNYWNDAMGVWGTVCGVGFSMVEAHVACKQMGFERALKWELSSTSEFGQGNQSSPIFLRDINCPSADVSHIMRCRPTQEPTNSCSHDDDVAIYCDESNSSYDGQVRLVSEIENSSISISSGRIEIHHNGVWGTVCNRDFNQAAADTVCRQLSYTNALDIYSALPGEGQVLVDDITCTASSSCFKSCFNSHHLPHQCNHTSDVAVQCSYDISLAVENTSGNIHQCRISSLSLILLFSIAILTLSSLLVLGSIASASLCVACYIIRKRRQKFKLYEPLS